MLRLRSAVARVCAVAPTASIQHGIRRVVTQQRRLYGADHHDDHGHAPAPHKTSFRQPLPADLPKTAEQRKKELEEASGWLFGSQVVYVDPDKPFEHQYKGANGWMFSRPPRQPGEPYDWESWEGISYFFTAIIVAMTLLFVWAKSDFNMYDWAQDEIIERRIIKKRNETRESS